MKGGIVMKTITAEHLMVMFLEKRGGKQLKIVVK